MNIATYDPMPLARQTVSSTTHEELSLSGIVDMLRRRFGVIVTVGSIVALSAAAYLTLQPAKYEASALMMIDPREDRVVSPDQKLSEVAQTSSYVDSEIEVINSRHMAERLAQSMNLAGDRRWNPSGATDEASLGAVTDRVAAAIDATRRGTTQVIELGVTARDPVLAAQMANKLVEVYLGEQVELGQSSVTQANSWLSQRLAELRTEVNEKEAAVENYRSQHGLLNAQGQTLTEQEISDVQASMLAARSDLSDREARYRQVQAILASGSSPEMVAGVINSDTIRDLRAREADVARRQADMESRYGDLHPALQNVRAERADIQNQIRAEVSRIASNLQSEAQVSRARLNTLQGHLNSIRGSLVSNNSDQVQLRQLEREATAARAVYESFLQRSHEISEQGNLNTTEARLLSPATPPTQPSSPHIPTALAIALMLGLAAGLIAGMLVHQFDDTLGSADDIDREVGVPAVASIPVTSRKALGKLPLAERHPGGFLVANPLSAFAESFRVLRASIIYSQEHARHKIVAVTSAVPGEGKTTSALCLARIAAMSGEKVILLDCDIRRRSMNDLLDIAPQAGLLEVLAGQRHWRTVIGRDEATGAHVLPLSVTDTPLHDVFGSATMKKLADELASEYDLVVFDCAPVLAVAETRALVALADVVILVSRWRKTRARALAAAIAQVEATGATVSGVALNCVDPRAPGRYSHSDSLYYVDAGKAYYNA